MSKKHKTYTTEFKAEAIKLIEANQGNVSETARQLSISMQTLSNWNTKAKAGTLAGTKQYSPDLNALLEENKKLKQQLKIAEVEREFLKKAAAYFAANYWISRPPILVRGLPLIPIPSRPLKLKK